MADETEDKQLSLERLTLGVQSVFDDAGKGFYLVVEANGNVAGGLLVTREWSDWRNAYYWWIQSVYVAPEFRGQGAYARLHRHVLELASKSGEVCAVRLYVDRDNARAKSVYGKMGMKPGRYDFYEVDVTPGN